MWSAAMLCGGLVLVLVFFMVVGVSDVAATAPLAAVLALAATVFWLATMAFFGRSRTHGNTRWFDRERRGF